MKTYDIKFQLKVDKRWVDDGLNAKTLKRRIKEELPGQLCQYAYGNEIVVKKITVINKRRA